MPISPVFNTIAQNFPQNLQQNFQDYKWKKANSNPSVQNNRGIEEINFKKDFPWLKDKTLQSSIELLNEITFSEKDIAEMKSIGVNVPFKNGKEAVDFLKKNNIRISFEKPADQNVHAQYEFATNIIGINKKYKKCMDFPVILAIAEAILHETSHAFDNDGDSSIQEELDCLGMNAVSHRAFLKKYGDLFNNSDAPIVNDGVSLYAKLFFDTDPSKQKLVQRVREKYGYLPSGDKVHPAGNLAREIKYLG